MVSIKDTPLVQSDKARDVSPAQPNLGGATTPSADRAQMRQDVMARALTDVPIKNQALVNYAYKVLGAERSYTEARQELQKRFGVDLAQIETERQGTSTIKLTKENGKEMQDLLIGRFKGYSGAQQAQAASAQPSAEIPRALPVEEIPNQKLINYAYKVLKVEQRGLVAEKELKTQFGVDLDSLIANRDGVSYVTRKPGPGGNESAVLAVLDAGGERGPRGTSREAEGRGRGPRTPTLHTQSLAGRGFIAQSVIEPGGGLFKHVRDTITDTRGNPVVKVERTRLNLGPFSINLPGRQYEIASGVPEEQAKELANQHIRNISRRD